MDTSSGRLIFGGHTPSHNPVFAGVAFAGLFDKVASSPIYCQRRMRQLLSRPAYLLSVLWLLCLAVCAGAVWFVMQQPSLGLEFVVKDGQVQALPNGASSNVQIPSGASMFRVNGVEIKAEDLNADPDFLSYAEQNAYYARQTELYSMLRMPKVQLTWKDRDSDTDNVTVIQPHPRTLGSIQPVFWFQLGVVSICVLIGGWVFVLKPGDWGARMFALTGLMLLLSGVTAAVMFTNELAYSGTLLKVLLKLNHLGGYVFGCALVALFLNYPKQLVAPRTLLWLPVFYGAWFLAELGEVIAPSQSASMEMISQLLLGMICAAVQWQRTRGQPLERAALRWFLLSILLCCNLFAFTYVIPPMLGLPSLLDFGYALAFFLIMYVGIALGLRRYRLFDMDEWAYRVFLWVAGATAVILLDALLIFTGVTQSASLGISLLACGWLYFPFRQWLWQRIVMKQTPNFESLLPELSSIAFTATENAQREGWEALLSHLYDPLEIKPAETDGGGIREEGLAMLVPGCGKLPAYQLRYAGHGARLFSSRDATFAASLSHLLEQVMSGRTSYEQGVTQERLRLGRDLHDNIGARLLKLIHHLRGTPSAEVARDAMKDLRTAIAAMDANPVPLANALGDWRAEAGSRCDAAACRLQWLQPEELPAVQLAPRAKAMLESVMREIITNALKHAAPGLIEVEITANPQMLRVIVGNDGAIADPLTWKNGYGLRNMRGRLEELGGRLNIASATNKVQLIAEVPLT
jgi:signal transduction histidine kinase